MIHYRNTAVTSTAVQIAAADANGYTLTGYNMINSANTTDVYVKFYDALAANVTVGTTTPVMTRMIPAGGAIIEEANSKSEIYTFTTGITIAVVTGLADSSTTAPSSAIHICIDYQN